MFPSVNGSSAFQTNLYCMERKKQDWRKAGEAILYAGQYTKMIVLNPVWENTECSCASTEAMPAWWERAVRRQGVWEWGFWKGRHCPIRWFMQRGRYSLLKQIHLDGFHAVSFQEGFCLAADRHASECNQQEIHGLAKWNIYSGKTVRREMKSIMTFLSCDADGLSAVVLWWKKLQGWKKKRMPVSGIHFFFSFCKFF